LYATTTAFNTSYATTTVFNTTGATSKTTDTSKSTVFGTTTTFNTLYATTTAFNTSYATTTVFNTTGATSKTTDTSRTTTFGTSTVFNTSYATTTVFNTSQGTSKTTDTSRSTVYATTTTFNTLFATTTNFDTSLSTVRYTSESPSLIDLSGWQVGSGSVTTGSTSFYINGTTDENRRIVDTNPHGDAAIVWESPANDAASNDDGGWNSSLFNIDPTKKYRWSVWIRKKDLIGNGRAYLGLIGYNSADSNIGVLSRVGGGVDTNPYFLYPRFDTDFSSTVDTWYLFVGHVWPTGSGTGSDDPDSGLWNAAGTKLLSPVTDYVWQATNAKATHRSYQYYSTTTNEKQQWWDPRVDLIDGTEPTLTELLNGQYHVNQNTTTTYNTAYGTTTAYNTSYATTTVYV